MKKLFLFCLAVAATMTLRAADDLSLPDPLLTRAGEKVTTIDQWQKGRRQEILELFRENIYGRAPIGRPDTLRFDVKEVDTHAMNGKATLKRVEIHFSGPGGKGMISLSVFIPNKAKKPVPGFLLICNQDRDNIDPTRIKKSPYWPAERIVERGYVAATFLNADLDPDQHDGFKNGVHGIFDPQNSKRSPEA